MNSVSPDQISCVIPYAGAEKYLTGVLASATQQRFQEVIIVNDGCNPQPLKVAASQPGVRLIHLDDLLCEGYVEAMISWVTERRLRCAAATLRYIGENPARVGAVVSRNPDFFLPSGFFSEVRLLQEVGYFPDSCGDDLLLFQAIRRVTELTTCPGAGVLYRIHPRAESSRNTLLWWAFTRLLPLYENGERSLPEINRIAREYATDGTVPDELEWRLSGSDAAHGRLLIRSTYASWLNRDLAGVLRYGLKSLRYLPDLIRLARFKWARPRG
jgi:glycosyltransferase involved in cell wall biosynthesis